jgi:hypothetical protein
MPPHRMTTPSDDSGSESPLTTSEWGVLESYHRKGYSSNWSQKDKVVLTSALSKAYGTPSALRPGDLAKILRWIQEGSESKQ